MAFMPLVLGAAGALYQGARAKQAADANAEMMQTEQHIAVDQATAQEGLVRRQGREALGREAAAFGAAGVGYGGSSGTALKQSAINEELDALTTRYRGAITGYGYGIQALNLRQEGDEAMASGILLAGSRALAASSGSYTSGDTSLGGPG